MSNTKKEFKEKLQNVPVEIFDEIKDLLAKYDINNAEVSNLKITPLDNPTQQDCYRIGKKLHCIYRGDGTSYCWCA